MKEKICCFFGHRSIKDSPQLRAHLYAILQDLIVNEGYNTFLFGSMSQFYPLCYKIVTQLKEEYPYIKRIYVRSEYPYIVGSYREQISAQFENTYFFHPQKHQDKVPYLERNFQMIQQAQVCVVYYKNKRQSGKVIHNGVETIRPKSGTAIAYRYALKKGKRIINVMEGLHSVDETPSLSPVAEATAGLKPARRKPGTGSIRQLEGALWEGKFSPVNAHGKRIVRYVTATSREACEKKLAQLIRQLKAEIAAEKKDLSAQ